MNLKKWKSSLVLIVVKYQRKIEEFINLGYIVIGERSRHWARRPDVSITFSMLDLFEYYCYFMNFNFDPPKSCRSTFLVALLSRFSLIPSRNFKVQNCGVSLERDYHELKEIRSINPFLLDKIYTHPPLYSVSKINTEKSSKLIVRFLYAYIILRH